MEVALGLLTASDYSATNCVCVTGNFFMVRVHMSGNLASYMHLEKDEYCGGVRPSTKCLGGGKAH